MPFKLLSNYAVLSSDGRGTSTLGGDAFWSQPPENLEKLGRDWLVSEFLFTASWESQEIHPEADEFCYVIEGEVTLHLESDDRSSRKTVSLDTGSAFLIPRNTWHTAEVAKPVRMIFITMGAGTQGRPSRASSAA